MAPTAEPEFAEVLAALGKPFDPDAVEWKPQTTTKDKTRALAVAYVDAREYQKRLDAAYPWWTSSCEVQITPVMPERPERSEVPAKVFVVCTLGLNESYRSDVGECVLDDPNALTSAQAQAFKRACTQFGLGRYLYDLPKTWVPYDNDRQAITPEGLVELRRGLTGEKGTVSSAAPSAAPEVKPSKEAPPACPKCSGPMWDNRTSKTNPKAPDYKCKDKECGGAIWLKSGAAKAGNGNGSLDLADIKSDLFQSHVRSLYKLPWFQLKGSEEAVDLLKVRQAAYKEGFKEVTDANAREAFAAVQKYGKAQWAAETAKAGE